MIIIKILLSEYHYKNYKKNLIIIYILIKKKNLWSSSQKKWILQEKIIVPLITICLSIYKYKEPYRIRIYLKRIASTEIINLRVL